MLQEQKRKVLYTKNNRQTRVKHLFIDYSKKNYLIMNENLSTFFRAIPVPRATACNGSSAMWN